MPQYIPVDRDPFASAAPTLKPVDFDPFKETDVTQNPTQQQAAPPSGVFPPVAAVPQSPEPVNAPPPSTAPESPTDPGIVSELTGSLVKGLHSANRGRYLLQHALGTREGALEDFLNSVEESPKLDAQYPVGPSTRKAQEEMSTLTDSGMGGFLPALGIYAKNPRMSIGMTLESLPSMVPSMATTPLGALAGGAVGGPAGAVLGARLGAGVGSALGDAGSAFEDYVRDNYKPQTREDWRAIMNDPEKYNAAIRYAEIHSGTVGAFTSAGMGIGGAVGSRIVGDKIANPVGRVLASGVAGAPVASAIEAGGEAAGEYLGAGKIDPTQVAGEFIGSLVSDVGTTAVEPAIHATNFGSGKNTPVAAGDVQAATAALRPLVDTPLPENISGTMSAAAPEPTFYSPARRYIEEKGPGAATAEVWANTLRNAPGIKQEELADTGLHAFLGENPGKLTKKQVLDHLDENAIRLEETHRTNDIQRDPTFGTRMDTNHAKYEGYTLPGERGGYTEVTMHVPTRNVEGDNTQRDFVGGHYPEPNVVSTFRVTDRIDVNGVPVALIEEIQADSHQAGRKRGYTGQEMTDPAFMDSIDERIVQHISRPEQQGSALYRAFQGATGDAALVEAVRTGVITQEEATRYARDMKGTNPVPDLPFKQSWDELAFKRMLRWAADKGYRRVAWVNAAEQMRRYPATMGGSENRAAGMQKFYDQIVPSIAKKWAKRLGGTIGETTIPAGDVKTAVVTDTGVGTFVVTTPEGQRLPGTQMHRNAIQAQIEADRISNAGATSRIQYIDIPQAGVDMIQRGLPMYSEVDESRKKPGKVTLEDLISPPTIPQRVSQDIGNSLGQALQEVIRNLGLTVKVGLILHEGKQVVLRDSSGRSHAFNALGLVVGASGSRPEIHIALGKHKTAAEVWATMTHEMGHVIMEDKFANASPEVQAMIRAAYDEFRANTSHNENMNNLIARRDNAMIAYHQTRGTWTNAIGQQTTLDQLNVDKRQYWVGFEEWFAEQVARWATSNIRPLSTVEKYFKGVGHEILKFLEAAMKKFNLPFTASNAMDSWLNSLHTDMGPFAENIITKMNVKTQTENQKQMGPEEKAVERQPETVGAREGIGKLFDGRPPKEVQVAAAYADKFNKIYKYMLGIHQVAQRNERIAPLQKYTETLAVAQLTKQQIMIRAQQVLKAWNKLGGAMGDNLAAFIDDVQNMVYLTPDEEKNKVARFPTQTEMAALVKKHGLNQEALAVFKDIADTFNEHLTRYEAVLRNEAKKITDTKKLNDRMEAITKMIANLRSRPYFPSMRFGNYTITVRNDAKQVIHFETFEYRFQQRRAAEAIQAQYKVGQDNMELGKLDPTVKPLMGVPTQLLELMATKLELNKKQRDALDQMKYELSPAQSFKHRFQHKKRVAGYSQDFRRAYANYFFHGANHLMRAMYADDLRNLTKQTKAETQGVYDVTTRHEIVAYMNDHLENWLDPKSDWHAVRSIAFLWSLAYTPAAAAQNLTQTLMTSFPFLAQQFGDLKAISALMRAGADFTTYYKTGTMKNMTDIELRIISRGLQRGTIAEAMAPELAGFAEGRTLGLGFGGNELQRYIQGFNEYGAKMFELAEQVNRRLIFRATLKLVQENPGEKYIQTVVKKRQQEYDLARKEGFTETEAAMYVAATDATLATQFQYGREYAPRFMRGKARSIFVFKTFIQNYVLFLANYPGAAVRSILIMGFLGGLMGIPGGDDLKEILKAIAWQMFGKQFDLEREARRMIIQLLGEDESGRVGADMILHGVSRQGYGIPAVMDMLSGTVGIDVPMPRFDRSAAISAGTLLPVELGKLFGPPTQSADEVISGQAQKASGAVFGAGFNIYKALVNQKLNGDDFKRYEKAVPRFLGNISKSSRVYSEGRERTGTGSTLVKYDVRDPTELMEVIGMGMGYTPYRQSLQWNRIMAGQEVVKLWDIRRTGLMKQFGNAALGHDEKEMARVKEAIKNFNTGLPEEARGKAISSDTLRQSVGTQARSRSAQEAELSVKKSDIPILREVQKLFPASQATSVRRVPKTLQ